MDQLIGITKQELTKLIGKEMDRKLKRYIAHSNSNVENDKINQFEAAQIVGVSLPTLNKLVKQGRFTQLSAGRKKYFIKSRLIEELKSCDIDR